MLAEDKKIKEEIQEKEKIEVSQEELKKENNYKKTQQTKNLISLVILLAGLLVGSLFVDVAQIIQGGGYSQKNLHKSDIFEADGKTWVAYSEPAVGIKVIDDDKCAKCDPSEILVWLRRVLPTISAEKINYKSKEGKKLIQQFGIKTLPAFIFNQKVNKTDLYTQAKVLFKDKNNQYIFDIQKLGVPIGKYLQVPKIKDKDAIFGKAEAKVKVIIFGDFQSPYSKLSYDSLRKVMKTYQDKVFFDYKELPSSVRPQSLNAALAAECALEQNKFWLYADNLYTKQSQWDNVKGTVKFKQYARDLKLKTNQFNQCLDSKKYQDKIDADKKEALDFEISTTPAIFINNQFENGVVSEKQLKEDIEKQLKK